MLSLQALASGSIGQENGNYFSQPDDADQQHGMYIYMSMDQLMLLVDCLVESHQFARRFNSNTEQRQLLYKAGTKGHSERESTSPGACSLEGYRGKVKPNLFQQETTSIACALRILFRLYNDAKYTDSSEPLQRRILKYERF